MEKSKVLGSLVGLIILIGLVVPTSVLAADDNISFNFKISSYWQNGKEASGRYRQTDNVNN